MSARPLFHPVLLLVNVTLKYDPVATVAIPANCHPERTLFLPGPQHSGYRGAGPGYGLRDECAAAPAERPLFRARGLSGVGQRLRLLRRKIEEYYSAEGRQDAIRIRIPKGGYLPVFEDSAPLGSGAPPATVDPVKRRPPPVWFASALLVLPALLYGGYRWLAPPRHTVLVRQFWAEIFNSGQPSVLVSSDTAFVLFQNYSRRTVSLSEYLNGDFWQKFEPSSDIRPSWIFALRGLPYTNSVDLAFFWRLARKPAFDLSRSSVRAARDLHLTDLKGSNAVLIGARRANPWVELFDRKNNFQGLFNQELKDYIVNRAPRSSEQAVYQAGTSSGVTRSYALVEFNRGLSGAEHVLILSGLSSPSTEGAADFLLNDLALGRFLQTISPAHDEVPHFELLLAVDLINSSAPRTEIVAYRVRGD